MGRVAKYKKLKSCDPFSAQNRSRLAHLDTVVGVWGLEASGRKPKKRSLRSLKLREQKSKKKPRPDNGFDAPPTSDDDFDMNDLTGSLRRSADTASEYDVGGHDNLAAQLAKTAKKASGQHPGEESSFQFATATTLSVVAVDGDADVRRLGLHKQLDAFNNSKTINMDRREHESRNAYKKRIRTEAQQAILQERQKKRNPEKVQRKKEFLKLKKLKRKGATGAGNDSIGHGADDDSDILITGERAARARALAADEPKFGEQAERPPVFRQFPRGAVTKASHVTGSSQNSKQSEMEALRRKVQAQYALIRQQRQRNS